MPRALLIVISTSLLPWAHLTPQQLGQRIRVLPTADAPTRWIIGELLAQDGDSLQLRVAGQAQPVSVARRAMVGALSQVGRQPARSCDVWYSSLCSLDREAHAVQAGLIGGAVGGLLGAALGYGVRSERWEGLPLGRAHVAVAPSGTGVGLSFAF